MKNIFFDLGHQFAYCCFENKILKTIKTKKLSSLSKKSLSNKIYEFDLFLKKEFQQDQKVNKIGCFFPFGTNRKTIIHLAMMTCVVMLHFNKSNFCFLNEWQTWMKIIKIKKIPLRKIKKDLTIKWAQKKFDLKEINDDQADALLGCYYLTFFD